MSNPERTSARRQQGSGSSAGGQSMETGLPAERSSPSTLHLKDPRDIRALAHPARMAILAALASGDELTATECAQLTGLSPSATSYHLKLMERYGYVEAAPVRADKRDRPWRTTPRRASTDLDVSTPAGSAAASEVINAYIDQSRAIATNFVASEHEEPEEWQLAATMASSDLWITAEEAKQLQAALASALQPYRERTLNERPDASRRLRVMYLLAPHRLAT